MPDRQRGWFIRHNDAAGIGTGSSPWDFGALEQLSLTDAPLSQILWHSQIVASLAQLTPLYSRTHSWSCDVLRDLPQFQRIRSTIADD